MPYNPAEQSRAAQKAEATISIELSVLTSKAVSPDVARRDGYQSITVPFSTYMRDSRFQFLSICRDMANVPHRIVRIGPRSFELWRLAKDLRIDANSDERQRQERLKKH